MCFVLVFVLLFVCTYVFTLTHCHSERGVTGVHAHEVAWDVMANKCSVRRYAPVAIIKVPQKALHQFREANRLKCDEESLLPMFSSAMEYACLGKTHFCHAHKLGKQGGRTLFNEGKVVIKFHETDEEAQAIAQDGPLCVLYDEELWDDMAAIEAIAGEDNLNAACQMEEDEMTAFMYVHMLLKTEQGSQPKVVSKADLMKKIRDRGLRTFRIPDWEAFIALRMLWPSAVAETFYRCQFACGAGLVRVKPVDFETTAGLGHGFHGKLPWTQMSIMLFQYCGSTTLPKTRGPEGIAEASSFTGHRISFAKKVNPSVIEDLNVEIDFVTSVETFVKRIMKYYVQDPGSTPSQAAVVETRTNLLVSAGRTVLTVGYHLQNVGHKSGTEAYRNRRQEIIQEQMQNRFGKLERHYRQSLVSKSFLSSERLPEPLHPYDPKADKGKADTCSQPKTHTAVVYDAVGNVQASLQEVCDRLGISPQGGAVGLRTPQLYKQSSEGKSAPDIEGVQLIRFNLPEVTVRVTYADKSVEEMVVGADSLKAVEQTVVAKAIDLYTFKSDGSQPTVPRADLDRGFEKYACLCVEKVLLDASYASVLSSEHVQMTVLSDEGKLPLLLQVRVHQAFKKNQLVLAPVGGKLLPKSKSSSMSALVQKMHDAYIPGVACSLTAISKKSKAAPVAKVHNLQFNLYSPMAVSCLPKDLSEIFPFWGVLRSGRDPSHQPNMRMDTAFFEIPKFKIVGGSSVGHMPLQVTVELPVFVNSVALNKDDVLLATYQGGTSVIM